MFGIIVQFLDPLTVHIRLFFPPPDKSVRATILTADLYVLWKIIGKIRQAASSKHKLER